MVRFGIKGYSLDELCASGTQEKETELDNTCSHEHGRSEVGRK